MIYKSTLYQDTVFSSGAIHALRCFMNLQDQYNGSNGINNAYRDAMLRIANTMPLIDEHGHFEVDESDGQIKFRYRKESTTGNG